MTAIIAYQNRKKTLYFAAERQISTGSSHYLHPIPKIKERDGYLLGAAGTGYICSLIQELAPLPVLPPKLVNQQDLLIFMLTDLLPEWIEFLRKQNLMDPNELRLIGSEPKSIDDFVPDIQVLIGANNVLFEFAASVSSIHFDIAPTPFAIGCGGNPLLIAFDVLDGLNLSNRKRLEKAFSVMNKHTEYCGKDFDILSIAQ